MALDAPLNDRQIDVLRWISEGCPDGRWTDFTFKTTAAALASRRLVSISKRGGTWSAALLAAGERYLATGRYPADHWKPRRGGSGAVSNKPVRTAVVATRPIAESVQAMAARPSIQSASRARALVAEVVAAGGKIRRESKEGPRAFSSLIAAANRHKLAPEGQQLTLDTGGRWEVCVIRLEAAPFWKTTPALEVVQAARIGKWHPALTDICHHDFISMSVTAERRMLRILQALAVEAEARGHRVEAIVPRRRYHHRQSAAGHLVVRVREYRYILAVWQKYRETPPPTRWGQTPKRPSSDPLESLAIGLMWESGGRMGITESWSDAHPKRIKLESLLPKVLWELEKRSDRADQRHQQERVAAIERERLLAEAERRARLLHAENVRIETLHTQHRNWREAIQLREYIASMEAVVNAIAADDERRDAQAWLQWSRDYVDTSLDPLKQRLVMPDIRAWTREEQNALQTALFRELQHASDDCK